MEFEISNLEVNNVIFFSEDGISFSSSSCAILRLRKRNRFFADPDKFFLFQTDLLHGSEPVGDGEITASCSDWHEKIWLDETIMFVPSPLMFRKVGDHLKKTGKEDQ